MSGFEVCNFFDIEAIDTLEDEEEVFEEGDDLSYFVRDDELGCGDEAAIAPQPGLDGMNVQHLDDDARWIAGRIRQKNTRSAHTAIDDDIVPLRVPREGDPDVWSVRVKLGREADVVFQICRRCLSPSEIRPPVITSAFARSSLPGLIFIEAFDVKEVRRAVDGLIAIRDRQPLFIPPTEYTRLLSWRPPLASQIANGQWVRSLAGRYRGDLGYVCEIDLPMRQWYAIVAFVPRIGGKRQRDGRPVPRAWTAAEVAKQYGERRVKVLGLNQFTFQGCLYEDGLAFEAMPWSLLCVLEDSPREITPFVQSPSIASLPTFSTTLRHFTQDLLRVGDRVLVVTGEHAGIIGRIEELHDNVADVVSQIPEGHSGLVISITLRDLIPYFMAGDHVKMHSSDFFGMVIAVDHDACKVTFLDKNTNAETNTSTFSLQFYSPPFRFFNFTPGLYVEYPGADGVMRRGSIVCASGDKAQIMDEKNGQRIDVNRDDVMVSGVQGAALPKPVHNRVWEGQRVSIIKGPLKGYRGLVKAEGRDDFDIELDAKLLHGPSRHRFQLGDFQLELEKYWAEPSGRSIRTPPPEDLRFARRTPPPEDLPAREEHLPNPYPCSVPRGLEKHWLFAEEIQEVLREECIPFHVQGVPASSPHAGMVGISAKTVPLARQKIDPQPNEVVVSVIQRGKPSQISIDPAYLVPWAPSQGNKVAIIGYRWIGQVGKLVESKDGVCSVELESSGTLLYFTDQDVVNLLKK